MDDDDDNMVTMVLTCAVGELRDVRVALTYERGHAMDAIATLYELGDPDTLEDLILVLEGDPSVDIAIQLSEMMSDDPESD